MPLHWENKDLKRGIVWSLSTWLTSLIGSRFSATARENPETWGRCLRFRQTMSTNHVRQTMVWWLCVCVLVVFRKESWLAFSLFSYSILLLNFFFYYYVRFKPGITYVSLRGSAVHRDDLWPCFMLCVKSEQIGSANTQAAGTQWPTERWLRGSAGMCWALVWVTTMRGDQMGTWVGFQNHGQNTEALVQAPLCCWGVSFLTQISPAVFSVNQSGENTRVTRGKACMRNIETSTLKIYMYKIYFASVVIQNPANLKSCVDVLYFIIPFYL